MYVYISIKNKLSTLNNGEIDVQLTFSGYTIA